MSLVSAWRAWRFKRAVNRDANRAIAICTAHWNEYWATVTSVPIGNPKETGDRMLSWHVDNFASGIAPMFSIHAPAVMVNENMFWLVILNGILDSRTHDVKQVQEAIVGRHLHESANTRTS